MAHNHIPVYMESSSQTQSTGAWGIFVATMPTGGVTYAGPYYAGTFYIDTGIDAPTGTTSNLTNPSEMYQARVWPVTVSVSGVVGISSGNNTAKVSIDAEVVFRTQMKYTASAADTERLYIKCDVYFSDVYAKQSVDGQYCSYRLDDTKWALWRL